MKKLIDRFDRAYIINLRDRSDRRAGAIEEFAKAGIPVPGDRIAFYSAERPAERGDFPTVGARGSFTSHWEVLRLAVRDGLRNVLVFEDDVFFRLVDEAAVDRILQYLDRAEWDIVYFGYLQPDHVDLAGPLASWQGTTIGGHFYAVNGPFIRRMADYMEACAGRPAGAPLGGPTYRDGAYNNARLAFPGLRVYLAVPSLAGQRSSRTDLHPLKIYDRVIWMRPMMHGLRRVKNRMRSIAAKLRAPGAAARGRPEK